MPVNPLFGILAIGSNPLQQSHQRRAYVLDLLLR